MLAFDRCCSLNQRLIHGEKIDWQLFQGGEGHPSSWYDLHVRLDEFT